MTDTSERSRETERRRATVLFADITGFTTLSERLDPEEAFEIVTGALKLLDGIARKHGGSVDKYLGDAVLAVFGVPLAMDEAPKAAINAAIEMRRRVHQYNEETRPLIPLDIHSGINTGLMISGDVSGPIHREFAVLGDAVNIAARLKDLAPKGEIWVGEETWRSTREEFEFTPVEKLALKGKDRQVRVYRVETGHERLHRRALDPRSPLWSGLVGRDAELARITDAVDALGEGEAGGFLAVVAEAGLGKSRLLLEARERCAEGAAVWLEGRSVAAAPGVGYHAFRDLLGRWMGIEAAAGDDADALAQLDRMLSHFGIADEDHRPILASLMAVPVPPEQRRRLQGIEGEALEKLILKATGDLLRAAATERPLVLVFEDLHWADPSTRMLLTDLIPLVKAHRILVIAPCRPGFADTSDPLLELAEKIGGPRFSRMDLAPLDPLDTESLIDNLLAEGEVPAPVREAIESKTAGNPFYIGEVIRVLIDQGALVYDDGKLVATRSVDAIEIPGTVQEVVMSRIDRLDLSTKRVLQVMSVAGGNTPRTILEEIVADDHFAPGIERLIALDFIEPHERARQETFAFKHPLIQEVCYEAILKAARQDLHLRTAVALEAEVPQGTPGYHGMLAYHFSRGNDLESAEEYLFRAGDDAIRVAASSEALSYFQEASRIYLERHGDRVDPEKIAQLETKMALAHYHRGQQVDAIEHINLALEKRDVPISKSRGRLLLRTVSGAALVLARLYVPALQHRLPAATERDREVADLMFKRARSQTTTDPLRFVGDTVEAMRFNTTVDPATLPGVAGLYAGSGGLCAYSGMFGISRRFLEEARRHLDPNGVEEQLLVRFFEFVAALLEGPAVAAAPEIDPELLEETVRKGSLWDVCMYLGLLIKKKVYTGEFAAAADWIEYLRKLEAQYSYRVARENYQGGQAFLAVETGRYEAGIQAADRYLADNDEVLPNLLGLATRGKAEVLAGRLEAARETLKRADRLVESQGQVPPMHRSAHYRTHLLLEVVQGERAMAAGSTSEARAHARAARRPARFALRAASKVAWRRPEVLRLVARREALAGHRAKANAAWRRALAAAEAAGLRPERARIHLEVSTSLQREDRLAGFSSVEHRRHAEALLEELGLHPGPVLADTTLPE